MRIVITGGCGFLGRRLAIRLLQQGSGLGAIDELVLFDNAAPALPLPDDKRLRLVTGDIADRDTVARLIAPGTDAVFHLAAIVSGEAEANTDLGYRVNLDGTRAVLDACRALGTAPRRRLRQLARGLWRRLAAGGRRRHRAHPADLLRRPRRHWASSWSTTTAARGLSTAARCACRPWWCGPGRPNRAASTFASSIIREPLGRAGCGLPGLARHGHGVGLAAPHRRGARPCPRSAGRGLRREPRPCNCRASRSRSARWRRRCAAPAARRPMPASAGSPTRRSRRSSRAGRRPW